MPSLRSLLEARSRAEDSACILRVLRALALVLVPLLASCEVDRADLDRVGAPLRFGDLRETARWSPGFDPAWLASIDRAYESYDADVARIASGSWEALLVELSDAGQIGFPTDRAGAREFWERHLRVRRELDQAESRLLDAIDSALPDEADGFIALMRARAAFWRASAVWAPHGERMPGPLEVLALTGEPVASEGLARAATEAYARLASVAARAAEERFRAYLEYCDAFEGAKAAERAARAAFRALPDEAPSEEFEVADARLSDASVALEEISRRLNARDRREADERIRVALLRENRAVAEAIESPERRADAFERIDAFLHVGVRSLPSIRAVKDLARRVAERRFPDEPERLARIDRAFETYAQAAAPLRARLASASASDRAAAYSALVGLVDPFIREISGAADVPGPSLDVLAISISTGRAGVDEAADALLSSLDSPPADVAEPTEIDAPLVDARRSIQIVCGNALSPRAIAALAGELELSVDASAELAALREAEVKALVERTAEIVRRFEEESRGVVEDAVEQPRARAKRAVAEARRAAAAVQALDRAANERILGEAARLGGVDAGDARVARARIELELASMIGSIETAEQQAICGLTRGAVVNPFEVVRRMKVDEAVREAATVLVASRADDLRVAHREAALGILRNLEDFLERLLERQRERQLEDQLEDQREERREGQQREETQEAWYAAEVGGKAVAAREAIAAEIGVVLGDEAESAFLAAWRALAHREMDPPRHDASAPLAAFAERRRLDPATARAEGESLAVVAEFLAQSDEARDRALRELGAWRARFTRSSEIDRSGGWKSIARHSAVGAMLRARAFDADERALARCEAILEGVPELADGLRTARRLPTLLPTRLAPYFPDGR